jgi:class 3 adenylate cyclase
MFVDVIGFTGLAEQLGPEVAYFAVTGAMRILDGIARKYGGSVDKYLGDCLMAVFGHPVPVAAPARAAASAGPHPKPRIGRGARPPA